MALAANQRKCQQGAMCLVRCPGCPGPSTRPHSPLQVQDALRLAPPAAHRAERFLTDTGDLIAEIGRHEKDLKALLEIRPHDKPEILRLVETIKKFAMTLHGQAVQACQDIKTGR